jgi:hypothetical protein
MFPAGLSPSAKLGTSGLVLMTVFFVLPFWYWHLPVGWTIGALSAVLGLLAARHGSKWWLLIPATVALMVVFIVAMTIFPE